MSANSTSSSTTFGKFLFGMFSILMLLSGSLKVNAQAALYTASTGNNASLVLDKNGNAIDMSAGTTQLHGANVSASGSATTNIGFSFYLLGGSTSFSQFTANVNGAIRLGSTGVGGSVVTASATGSFLLACNVAGKTDNTSGKVHSKLFGTSPNRVLVVEWKDVWVSSFGASNNNLSTYQTRIYEDGTVEYVYGAMFNNNTSTVNANIGISSSNTGGTILQVITPTTSPAFKTDSTAYRNNVIPLNSAINNLNSSADGSRRFFRFAPASCGPAPTTQPTVLVASATTNTFNSIGGSFTAAASGPGGYLVVRTTQNIEPTLTSGVNYMFDSSYSTNVDFRVVANGNSTTFTAAGLGSGRTYYFWVYSYNAPTTAAPCGNQVYNTTSPLTGQATTNVAVSPTCVTSTTPSNNFNGFSPVDTLRWTAVTSLPTVTTYFVYISKTQALVDANSPTVRTAVAGNVLKLQPGTLDYSTTYFWKVRAFNGVDTANCDTRSFTTAAPSVPLCYQGAVTPTSGATGVSTTANIVWGAAVGAPSPTGYDIYISTNSAAVQGLQLSARIISGTTALNFTPGITTIVLNPGTQYFWTVVPTNYIGGASGCTVYSFTTYAPGKITSTTKGGLWSDPNTWVGGAIPAANDSVVINDGAVVWVSSAPALVRNLIIGQNGANTAVLQVGTGPLTVSGNITINSNGRFLPFNASGTGVTVNVGGNFTNNGYTNLALGTTQLNFNGSQVGGGSAAQVLGGTGTFEGDTTGTGNGSVVGVIRDLRFQTTGSSAISTTQSLAVNGNFYHTGGSLNTNGKLMIDNSKQLYGRDINNQISAVNITTMGSGYSTATPPVVGPTGGLFWVASTTFTANQFRLTADNIYLVTASTGSSGLTAPTGTSTAAITDGAATLFWVGTSGTLGAPYNPATTRTVGTQYYYGNKLFTLYKINTASVTAANYSTLFGVLAAATTIGERVGSTLGDSLVYVGAPAKATVNLETSGLGSGTVRSLNLTSAGSGYYTATPTFAIVNMTSATVTGAAGTATFIQSSAGATNSAVFKVPNATITGGLTILSDLQVRGVSATVGGINYGGTPRVGFPLPTNFHNLVTRSGSGFTANPTLFRVYGGTTLPNFTNPTFNFNVAQGRLISAICTNGGTGWLTQPDSIRVPATTGTDSATIRFPANSLARATALMRARSVVGFRVTNAGDGYASAPTPTLDSTGNTGQAFTAASSLSSRVGLYNLTYQVLNPTILVSEGTTSAEIPANKQINVLTVNNKAKVKYAASSDTLKIIGGSGALSLSAAGTNPSGVNQYGTTLDMNGGLLFFYSPLYTGFGSVTNYGQQDAYGHVKNGSMRIALPGTTATTTGATRIFPFRSPVSLFTGTRTTNGSDGPSMGYVTVSESGVPSTTDPASKVPVGKKSYNVKAEPFISNASVSYGVNPLFLMVYGASDSLPSSLTFANLSIGQSSSASGTWVDRGRTLGSVVSGQTNVANNDFITAQLSVATTSTVTGPFVTNAGNDFFALLNIASNPTVTTITPSAFCSAGGEAVTLTGTGFIGTTQVLFNGLAAASFSVVSNTSITAVTPNGISAGNVTVISNGLTGVSSSTYSVRNIGTFTPTVNPPNGLICSATDRVTISLNDIGADSYSWSPSTGLDVAQGLSVVATPTASTTYTVSAAFSASGSNAACTVTAKFVVGPIPGTPIVPTASPAASCFNAGQTVTLNSNLSAGNFTVSNITYAPSTVPSTATNLADRGNVPAGVNYQCAFCPLDDAGFPNIPIGFNFNFFGSFFDKLSAGTNGLLLFGQVPSYAANAGINQYTFNNTPVTFPNAENPGNVIAAGIADLGAQTASQNLTCTLTSGSNTVTTANGYIFNIGDSLVGTGIPAGTLVTGVVSSTSASSGVGTTTFTMSNAATSSGSVSVSFQIKPFIRYWTEGSAPTRKFVFEYKSVGGSGGTNSANSGTVQVMLYETTGIVEMHIQKINNTTPRTYGLQDVTKQIGAVAPGRQAYGSGTFVAEAWRFAPPTNYGFLWSPSTGLDATNTSSVIYSVTSPGAKSVNLKVTNPVTGCVTNKVVPFLVNTTPNAPTVSGVLSVCGSGFTALTSNYPAAGNSIKWYDAAIGGTLLNTGTLFVTPVIFQTTTYYVEEVTNRVLNPCSSPRTAVTVSITTPPAFAVNKPVLCGNITSTQLNVTTDQSLYDTYTWAPVSGLFEDAGLSIPYSGRSIGTVYAGSLIPGYKKYICSASNFETLCATKDSSEIVVQPNTATISANPAVICVSGTSDLTLNTSTAPYAGTIQWQLSLDSTTFEDVVGATTATITAPNSLQIRYYRAIIKALNGSTCYTSPVYTLRTIDPRVSNPTAVGFCSTSGIPVMTASAPNGGTINWYSGANQTGGTSLGTGTTYSPEDPIIQTTNYYVGLTVDGCEGGRTLVTANVATPTPITVSNNRTVCNNGVAALSVTSAEANYNSYVWTPTANLYSNAAGTIPYVPGTSAITVYARTTTAGTTTYTVSASNASTQCTTSGSIEVTVLAASYSVSANRTAICGSSSNNTATLTISPSTGMGNGSFAWESGSDGITYNAIGAATSSTYTTPAITATTYYNALVKDQSGTTCFTAPITISYSNPSVSADSVNGGERCGSGPVALSVTNTVGLIKWYRTLSSVNSVATGNNYTPTVLTSTNYYVTITINGCEGSIRTAVPVTINASPALTLASTSQTVTCVNPIVEISVSSTLSDYDTYVWTPATNLYTDALATNAYIPGSSATTVYVKSDTAGVYIYTVSANNSLFCSNIKYDTVTVTATNPITATPVSATVCNNGITQLEVTSTLSNYDSYVWSPVANLYSDAAATTPYTAGQNFSTVYFKSATVGTSSFVVYGSNSGASCVGTDTVRLTVMPASGTITSSGAASFCRTGGATLTFAPASTLPSGASVQWQLSLNGTTYNDIPSATSLTLAISGVTTTTYYRANAKNGAGDICFSANYTQTVVNPTITGSTGGSRCGNGSVILTATASSGASLAWYTSINSTTVQSTSSSYTTPAVSVSQDFYVTAVIGTCESTPRTAVRATVASAPTATVSAAQTVCNNTAATVAVTSTLSDYDSYVWTTTPASDLSKLYTDAAGTIPYVGSTSASIVYLKTTTVGSTTVKLNATNSQTACSFTTASTTVAVQPASATAAITSGATLCKSGTATLTVTPATGYAAGVTQIWQTSLNGTDYTNLPLASATTYTTATLTASTYYRFMVLNSLGGTCFTTNANQVVVANPPITGTTPASRCGFGSVTLNATAAAGTISWYASQDAASNEGIGSSFATPTLSSTYTYWVGVKVGTCEGTRVPVVATVNPAPEVHVRVVGGVDSFKTVCNNVVTQINVMPEYVSNFDTYVWTPNVNLFTDAAGTIPYVDGASATTIYVKRTAIGATRYFCTATNAEGCANQDTAFISVQPGTASISGNPASICTSVSSSSSLSLVPGSGYATNTIQWQVSDGVAAYANITNATNSTYSATNTATRFYQTVIRDGAGATCFTTDPFQLVYNNPSVNLPYTKRSRCGRGSVELKAFASPGATIKWYTTEFGGSPLTPATDTTFITPAISAQTIYYVAAELNGCESLRVPDTATVSDPPVLTITAPQTVCNNVIATFTVESDPADYESYTWTPVTNLYTDPQATVAYVANSSAATVYARTASPGTVNYEISSSSLALGCSNLTTTSLSVQLLSATISGTPSALCINGTSTLQLNPATPYGVGSIQWERSTDGTTFAPTPGAVGTSYVTPNQTATRYYRASVKNGAGANCFVTPVFNLVVNNPAILTTTGATICGPKTATISATTTAGSQLKWYSSGRLDDVAVLATGASYTTPVLSSTTTFYVQSSTITDATCASPRIPVTVTYNQPPALSISAGSAAYCAGGSSSLVTITNGAASYDSYGWTPTTGITGDAQNGWVFNPQSTTTYTLVATQTTGNACNFNIPFAVTVNALPVIDSVRANGGTSATVCVGTPSTLNAYAGGIGSGPQTLPTGYASSSATSTADDEIFNVSIVGTTLNNTSTCATIAPGPGSAAALYANYTTSVAAPTLIAGSPYSGSITIGQCSSTPYSTGYAVFIDYNRDGDFADAGETAFTAGSSTSNAVAGTVRPFNFTVPLSATPGVTLMRVVAIESSSAPGATGTYTWGETEDYAVNILAITVINPDIVFTWSPGGATGASVVVNPSTTTTYTVAASNAITGCVAAETRSVTVNVNQLPTAPESSNSVQCGIAVPTCFVGGASNGDYRWYLAQTGGTALPGQVNNQLSGYSISTTTTFYVSIFNGTCESLRTPVTASVIQPDQLTAASSLTASCANGQITLSVTQNGTSNTYDYVWTASPVSGSGISTSVSGSSVDVTPTVAGTYVYTVTGTDATAGCVAANTVTVTVRPNPAIGTATATPSTFCAGGSTSLTINPSLSTGPQVLPTGYLPSNATNTADEDILRVVFGTLDNSSTCSTTGGTGSTLNLYSNYTTTVAAPTVIAGDSVTVGFTVGYCGTTAFQNIATMYFDWNRDGDFADAGEAAIGKAYGAAALGGTFYSGKIRIPVNASPGRTMMRVVLVEASTIAPTGTYTYGETEDYAINIIGSSFQGSNFTYTWSPGSLTGQTVSATPQVNTTYEATVTNPTTGCFSKATVDVTVNQLPPAPTGSTSEQCGVGVPAATVTSNSAAATPRFRWYLTQTGGTVLQDSTANTYTRTVDSTKVFWVAEVSAEGCEGPRASVTVNVAQPDQIQLTHSAGSICLGQSVDISSSYSPVNNLYDSYSIEGFPTTGSGLSSSTSLTDLGFATAPITITPTAPGTYVYLITAVDNSFGCSTVGKDTIIVNALPVVDSVKASATAVCAGGTVNLNAYSSLTANLPAPTTLPTGYCVGGGGTNNADEQIFAVSFASMTNVQTENCSSNYADYTNSIPAPTVMRGSSYPFSVTVNECDGPNFSSGVSLFIDYNRDGDFADAGETVASTTAVTASPYTKTVTVTIPAGASPGRTRMRVVVMENVASPTACGTFTYGEVEDYSVYIAGDVAQTIPVNPNLTYTWNPGSVTGASATVTPTGPTANYTVTINDPATGCTSVSNPVSITVNPLPSAPIGTNSIQCGAGVPTVSVASGDATASPTLTWYNSATPPTEITQYSNLFNSTNVASLNGATLFGSASLTGTRLTLTPNLTTQTGAITIPASGVNGKNYSVAFRMTTGGGGGADGLSYSFGDDADATSTTLNAEYGSGSKLKIGFDNFGTGATAAAGIRLIYGASINDPGQVVGTNGVLAYSSDLSWIGLTDVPVVATINNAGKLTMSVNGNAIFSNVQLPSGFTSANKSTWKHVFEARTGGSSMIHQIDSVVLNYTASDIVNTGTTYSQPISQTTTFYVAETSAAGCEGPRSAVVATVNIPDSIRATASSNSICIGSSVTLTATTTTGSNNNNYTFTWGSTTGSGITGTTSGGTGSFGNPTTTTVTPTAAGTYVFNLNGTDASGAQTCNVSSSVTVVVNSLPVLDSARASSTTVCSGAPVTLQAYSGFMDAGPATQPTGYCTVSNLGLSAASYFDMFSTTGATQNINNSASGYSASGYGDFNSQMAIASAGQTVNFNTTLVGTTVGVAIWIDWNRNGTFETSERVYSTTGYVSTASGSFIVPANATPGVSKMRVMMDFNTSVPANACAVSTSGRAEVEDYTFRVINGNNIDNSLNYTWNPGNITNNTGAITVNPTTTTTYTVSATNAAGCAATTTRSVTVTVVPVTATASASLNTVCNGTAVTLTATPTGSGPFTYSWSNGTSVVGTTATLSVTPSTTTTYTVTVRDVCNNPATSATTVTVNPLPTASISQSSPIVICAPNTQELTAVTSAASPVFTWSLNGNVIGGATTSSYTATASGSYTVAITDAATGCNSAVSSAVVITVNDQPTPIVITPSAPSICIGSSTTLSLTGGDIINPGTLALTENFNTNAPNWTITNGQSSPVVSNWTLRTAPLTYASPNGEGSFNNFSTPNGGKFILAVADAGGNGSVTNTIITSPVFNTTNFTLANLVFEHAYKFSAANEAKVEVSTNGGTSWTTLKTYTGSQGSTGNNNQVTRNDTISMAAYLNQTNLRIRYNYQSNYGFWWLIDNIRVTGTQNVPCTYSWTPSATLNTASGATVIASPTVQTTYTVTATSQFGCTRTQTATVSMITRPTGVISGTPTICNGSSGNLSIAVTGTGPWSGTLSNGTSFSGSTSPISVSVSPTSNTTYTIASLSDASCASIADDLSGSATVTVNARPTAAISGTQVICQGSSANLSIAVTGAGPWSGTLSNGASFSGSSSPITVSVTPSASSTTYTVATLSDANCASIAADLTGSAAVTWKFATSSTTPISACTSYQWNGNTYTSSGSYTYTTLNAVGCDSVAVLSLTIRNRTSSSTPAFICATQAPYSWNGSSYSASGTYTFTTTNAAGCDSFAILVLTVAESIPNPVASVTQPTCATATGTITVTSPVGSGLQYSIGGAYQSSTTFSGVAAGTYTLRVQAGSGCFSAQNTSVTVNPQPIIPGATTVTGQVNVCNVIGTSTAITYTASALGASTYTWSLPANTVLVSGQGTATISVRFLSGFASQPNKQIRVVASSICGSNAFKIYYLAAQLPITPSTIVPSATNVCPSIGTNVPITYTIPKVSGAASYIWNYPSTMSVTRPNGSGENDTVIVVTFASNYTSSSITVQAVNSCGTSGTRSIFVSRNNPSTPGLISGPTNACEYIGASGVNATYSITAAANVDSYTWTLPAGVSNVNGQGTNTITFRYPAGFTSGTVSVTSTNGCGTSASRSLTINRLTPITPSNIDVINTSSCPNRVYTYSVSALPGNATSLEWNVPNGGTIESGQGTRTITVSYTTGVIDGAVSVRSINNCGVSSYKTSIVKLAPCPAGPTAPITKGLPIAATNPMDVKVFPNPTTSNFNLQVITADQQEVVVRILDVQGRFIKSVKVAPYQTLSIGSELKSGSYMLEVRQGNNLKTTRVVKY